MSHGLISIWEGGRGSRCFTTRADDALLHPGMVACAEHLPKDNVQSCDGNTVQAVHLLSNRTEGKVVVAVVGGPGALHAVCFFTCRLGLGEERFPGCCSEVEPSWRGMKFMCYHLAGVRSGGGGVVQPFFCTLVSSSGHSRGDTLHCCVGLAGD